MTHWQRGAFRGAGVGAGIFFVTVLIGAIYLAIENGNLGVLVQGLVSLTVFGAFFGSLFEGVIHIGEQKEDRDG